jgi:hypothetical protein
MGRHANAGDRATIGAMIDADVDALVPVALAPDQCTAEGYVSALAAVGIDAHVRIDDGTAFSRTGSAYAGALSSGERFVYPILVSRVQRRTAQRVLQRTDVFPDHPAPSIGSVLLAAFFLGASMLLVALAAWARGDL